MIVPVKLFRETLQATLAESASAAQQRPAEVVAAKGSTQLCERYGADVAAWLEAGEAEGTRPSSRPQPTADMADAGAPGNAAPRHSWQQRAQSPTAPAAAVTTPARPADSGGLLSSGIAAVIPVSGNAAGGGGGGGGAPPANASQQEAPAAGSQHRAAASSSQPGRPRQAAVAEASAGPPPAPPASGSRTHWRFFAAGAVMAVVVHTALHWAMQLPWVRHMISRFIWMKPSFPWASASASGAAPG